MKRFLFIVLALGIAVTFPGCDWFREIFDIGSVELKVDNVSVTELNGMVDYITISIQNYGDKAADGVTYAIVFSTDDTIDYNGDTSFYENSAYIENDDWHDETIDWDEIETYITDNSVTVPVEEGYIGVIVDPHDNFDENDGTSDNSTYDDTRQTAVPSVDEWENNNSEGIATPITFDHTIVNAICPSDDADWFSFWVDNSKSYDIVTAAIGSVSSDTWIDVYDLWGVWEDSSGTGGGGEYAALLSWVPVETGMYSVRVTSDNAESGLYSLTIIEYP